jgi:UDP-glucuronate 4-epimerase
MNAKKILITGTAGFIGFHAASRFIKDGYEVVGIDIINDYYDINLKINRLLFHGINLNGNVTTNFISSNIYNNYRFIRMDIADHDLLVDLMTKENFDYVLHLAAQAGVRYSLDNPRAYIHSNIDGFLSILEGCRFSNVKHLIYASTSSVYGLNTKMPLSENDATEHPMALYAATKKANELMAHSYSHLFNLPTTGLRFFTVYGPWGRPDMALFLFLEAMINDRPIEVFNHGKMVRDFTYIDDIIESISRLIPNPAKKNSLWNGQKPEISSSSAPFSLYNIGNSSPTQLMKYIESLEKALNKTAIKKFLDIQPGDVPITHSDTSRLENFIHFKTQTDVTIGVQNFVDWYKNYYKKNPK